ncbi:MAG: polyphosphate polymerase domain-containing protein [Ruminococcaceae bacterium]|nr:polyphosphate polymerase domain-containing protein [Oscillospiraceae bacterium]
MAEFQFTFKRYEKKFLISEEQCQLLLERLDGRMVPDKYPHSTITNIYYDTPEFQIIRRSIDKPLYKEKLRLRSYGVPGESGRVFVEIKKKFKGVVYKRRVDMTLAQAREYLSGRARPPKESQITREIDYFLKFYKGIGPAMYISYERDSFASPTDSVLRITLDRQIIWRENDLDLAKGIYGEEILPPDSVLMEIKVPGVFPIWLVRILDDLKIKPISYSKYGTIFQVSRKRHLEEDVRDGKLTVTEKKGGIYSDI